MLARIREKEARIEEIEKILKNAEVVVTNSFHGMVCSVQDRREFVVFSREQCDTKIEELLDIFGLSDRMLVTGEEQYRASIDYDAVHKNIGEERKRSLAFLENELVGCK